MPSKPQNRLGIDLGIRLIKSLGTCLASDVECLADEAVLATRSRDWNAILDEELDVLDEVVVLVDDEVVVLDAPE